MLACLFFLQRSVLKQIFLAGKIRKKFHKILMILALLWNFQRSNWDRRFVHFWIFFFTLFADFLFHQKVFFFLNSIELWLVFLCFCFPKKISIWRRILPLFIFSVFSSLFRFLCLMIFRFFFFLAFQGWEGQTFLYDTCFGFFAIFFDFFVHFFFFVYVKIFFCLLSSLMKSWNNFYMALIFLPLFIFFLCFFIARQVTRKSSIFHQRMTYFWRILLLKTLIFSRVVRILLIVVSLP